MSTESRRHRRARMRLPRRIRPGDRPLLAPGDRLDCVVLAQAPGEQICVELASGAFLRLQVPPTPASPPTAAEQAAAALATDDENGADRAARPPEATETSGDSGTS